MTQSVATTENIKAITSPTHTNSTWIGSWQAGPITFQSYDYFTLNGNPIAYEASCTFTFNGTDHNGVAVPDSETISLKAKQQTTLQGPVLCDGNTENGKKGPMNQLRVDSSHHLTTDLRT